MDEYKKGSHEWGSFDRKSEKRKCRQRLKRAAAKEPTEPEVHPAEEALTTHDSAERGYLLCPWCGTAVEASGCFLSCPSCDYIGTCDGYPG